MHPIGVGYRRIRIGRPFGAAQRHQVAVTAGLHRLCHGRGPCLAALGDKLNAGAGFGFRATGGVAPYGFQFIDGRRAWHQGEQETLAAIIEHRAAGLSWAKVADKLSATGHRTRTGGQWTRQGAHQVHRAQDRAAA